MTMQRNEQPQLKSKREANLMALFALVVGAGIGSALTLLFAPKEGEAPQKELGSTLDKRLTDLEHQIDNLLFKFEDAVRDLP